VGFDPYHILGVQSSAGADEIRRAYRGLARRYHPDVNRSTEAEERFKLLAQAYSVLSDPKRRALFDEFGEDSLALAFDPRRARDGERRPTEPPPGRRTRASDEPADARRVSTTEATRRTRKPREESGEDTPPPASADVESQLEIDLLTALRGGKVKLPSPGGAVLTVELPAGVESGHRMRLKGRGRPGLRGGLPGDLYIEVVVLPHPFFHRDGQNLVLELPITLDEAWRGADIEIPTLEGWVRLPVPPGSRGGERLRLRGKGLPGASRRRGDLYVHLCLRLPDRLDAAGRSLERLAGLYSEDVRVGLRL
jgi:curved DNA-binding protein